MATGNSWGDNFRFSMESVGLSVPNSLFSTQEKAVATINSILGAIKTFGTRVTIAELVKSGTISQAFVIVGACSAAFYIGAAIGAAAYATGQWTADNLWAVNPSTGSLEKVVNDALILGISVPRQIALQSQRSAVSLQAATNGVRRAMA